MFVFVKGGNQKTQRKTLRAKQESTTNLTHISHRAGIEHGPHWRKVSALNRCAIPATLS